MEPATVFLRKTTSLVFRLLLIITPQSKLFCSLSGITLISKLIKPGLIIVLVLIIYIHSSSIEISHFNESRNVINPNYVNSLRIDLHSNIFLWSLYDTVLSSWYFIPVTSKIFKDALLTSPFLKLYKLNFNSCKITLKLVIYRIITSRNRHAFHLIKCRSATRRELYSFKSVIHLIKISKNKVYTVYFGFSSPLKTCKARLMISKTALFSKVLLICICNLYLVSQIRIFSLIQSKELTLCPPGGRFISSIKKLICFFTLEIPFLKPYTRRIFLEGIYYSASFLKTKLLPFSSVNKQICFTVSYSLFSALSFITRDLPRNTAVICTYLYLFKWQE